MQPVRVLLLHAQTPENATLSYQRAWPRHFAAHRRFRSTIVNLADPNANRLLRLRLRRGTRFDAVVLLHSVFSNANFLHGRALDAVKRLRAPKAFFIGNEYKGMPEKMRLCDELELDLLVSQFTTDEPLRLYRDRLPRTVVVGIPNTGWDATLFDARVPPDERPVDLGYRAFDGDVSLGHRERRELFERVTSTPHGLCVDASLSPSDRFDERGWAAFLNRCKGQLGTEAGGDYFELTDATRNAVETYRTENPEATFEDIRRRFFAGYDNPIPGRILSGRNVEAAGTLSVQVLLEGRYGGFFEPDVHYIPLRKDFSNLDEALAKFGDQNYRRTVRENALDVARELTYPKLIDRFHDALAALL